MNLIKINKEKCKKCSLCIDVCGMDVILAGSDGYPEINDKSICNFCGHCIAICPNNAVSNNQMDMKNFKEINYKKINPEDMYNFFILKRSIRSFLDKPIEKSIIKSLIDIAHMAPSSINCQERSFIVIQDKEMIKKLNNALLKYIIKTGKMLKAVTSWPLSLFMTQDSVRHLKNLKHDFDVAVKHTSNGDDYIFHNAPCLILFTGIDIDPFGKDNALGAMHYLMLYAEILGLGSCINGYLQSASKIAEKYIKLPKQHKVYGAIMLGYPKYKYTKTVDRLEPLVSFI